MTSIAVLGANGFVGTALLPHLVGVGHSVTAVARAQFEGQPGVDVRIVADGDWCRAVAGADVVVHLIARTHRMREGGSPAERLASYRSDNVELTRAVSRACEQEGVKRLVYLSSVKAMGESRAEPYTEADPCHPRDDYGVTKREAEVVISEAATEFTILRPPLVYGTGARGNVARLVRAIRSGIPLPLGRAAAPRSLISVGNLASAVNAAATQPSAAGQTFFVCDSELLTVRQFVEGLAEGVGRPARLVAVPPGMLRAVGHLTRSTELVDRLTSPLVVDGSRFRTSLGWSPPERAQDALRRVGRLG